MSCRGETTELLDLWQGVADVVVVDAMRSGAVVGHVRRSAAGDGPLPVDAFAGSTHAFGLAEAVELGRALGVLPERLVIIGIEGRAFAMGAAMSAEVSAAAAEVVAGILESNHA